MTLPAPLHAAIQTAESAMLANATGHLHRGYRHLIWRAFDDRPQSKIRSRCITYVSYLCAAKVLPNWAAYYPDDPYPLAVFELMKQHLLHNQEVPDLDKHVSNIFGHGEDLYSKHAMEIYYAQGETWETCDLTLLSKATGVCYTLSSCLEDVLEADEKYSEVPVSTDEEGNILEDEDPYEFDASINASISYVGKGFGDTKYWEKRVEFWQWWLHEAVPQAWDMASEISQVHHYP